MNLLDRCEIGCQECISADRRRDLDGDNSGWCVSDHHPRQEAPLSIAPCSTARAAPLPFLDGYALFLPPTPSCAPAALQIQNGF